MTSTLTESVRTDQEPYGERLFRRDVGEQDPRPAVAAQPPAGGAGRASRGEPQLRQRGRARHPATGRLAAAAPGARAQLRARLAAAGRPPAAAPAALSRCRTKPGAPIVSLPGATYGRRGRFPRPGRTGRGVAHAHDGARRAGPNDLDRRQGKHDQGARGVRAGGGRAGRQGGLLPGAVLRAVLLPGAGREVLRLRRVRAGSDGRAVRGAGPRARPGDGPAGVRAGAAGRPLQHRRGDRRGRDVPRQVPQDPHPARQRLLGEVLLPAGQPRLSGLRHRGRPGRRLHLLRPALPGGLAGARPQRRRDRLQPVGHQPRPVQLPLEAGADRRRGRQRVLRRHDQPGRHRGPRRRRLLRHVLLRRPRGQGRRRVRLRLRRPSCWSATSTWTCCARSATGGSSTATAGPTRTGTWCGREDRSSRAARSSTRPVRPRWTCSSRRDDRRAVRAGVRGRRPRTRPSTRPGST